MLFRPKDGKMCCLGFYALACGYDQTEIEQVETPQHLPDKDDMVRELLDDMGDNSDVCEELMEINDDQHRSNEVRETDLTDAFESIGITVEFVD
jgi:hypothetical protein